MEGMVHAEVQPQLDAVSLDPGRPLLIVDADDVLFHFVAGFERFLDVRGYHFDWDRFAATSSFMQGVQPRAAAPMDESRAKEIVHELVQAFFAAHTETLEPVRDAAASLADLSNRLQIVVLSNLPIAHRGARVRALTANGMDYPLVANIGPKGPAVRYLQSQVSAPVFFVDDIPHNHTSVRAEADGVICLHFIADARIAQVLKPAPDSHHRCDVWSEARRIIEQYLTDSGH